jgi:predicted amidohydrolase
MNKKTVGIVQCSISPDKDRNLARALELASGAKSDFVVFPELFTTGYGLKKENGEDVKGESVQALSRFAREHSTNVIGGSIIEKDRDKFYNTSFVFDRKGALVGRYSKKHLFRPLDEQNFFSSGLERENNGNCFVLDGIPVGVLICYDLRFSDILLEMKRHGAQIIFCPMEWPLVRTEVREAFARSRAAESHAYLVAANATGYSSGGDPKNLLDGRSSVSSPLGERIFRAGTEEGFYAVDLDLDVIEEAIERFGQVFVRE